MRTTVTNISIFSASTKLQAAFTAAVTNICTSSGHGFAGEEKVRVASSTTLPAGLSANTDYYVVKIDANTFYLSTILGGPAVDITDTGTGTHTFYLLGRNIFVGPYESSHISFHTSGSANFVVKFKLSEQEDAPSFKDAASTTNKWTFLQVVDLDSGANIDGSTGITLSGVDSNRTFEANVNNCQWITAEISSWVAGALDLSVSLSAEYF